MPFLFSSQPVQRHNMGTSLWQKNTFACFLCQQEFNREYAIHRHYKEQQTVYTCPLQKYPCEKKAWCKLQGLFSWYSRSKITRRSNPTIHFQFRGIIIFSREHLHFFDIFPILLSDSLHILETKKGIFACAICGKEFNTRRSKETAQQHYQNTHRPAGEFPCPICVNGKVYIRARYRNIHMRRLHNADYKDYFPDTPDQR